MVERFEVADVMERLSVGFESGETREMYNLSVDQAHTFFVGDGEWLVHKQNRPATGPC